MSIPRNKPSGTQLAVLVVFTVFILMVCAVWVIPPLLSPLVGPSIEPGNTARMPENMLVKVVNPEPLETRKGDFGFGDQCLALEGDVVTAMATHRGRVLLRHEKPSEFFYGVCPKGIYFFAERKDFLTMTKRYTENIKKNKAEKKLVESILEKAEVPDSPP
jgi:hypothetical protein